MILKVSPAFVIAALLAFPLQPHAAENIQKKILGCWVARLDGTDESLHKCFREQGIWHGASFSGGHGADDGGRYKIENDRLIFIASEGGFDQDCEVVFGRWAEMETIEFKECGYEGGVYHRVPD